MKRSLWLPLAGVALATLAWAGVAAASRTARTGSSRAECTPCDDACIERCIEQCGPEKAQECLERCREGGDGDCSPSGGCPMSSDKCTPDAPPCREACSATHR